MCKNVVREIKVELNIVKLLLVKYWGIVRFEFNVLENNDILIDEIGFVCILLLFDSYVLLGDIISVYWWLIC